MEKIDTTTVDKIKDIVKLQVVQNTYLIISITMIYQDSELDLVSYKAHMSISHTRSITTRDKSGQKTFWAE